MFSLRKYIQDTMVAGREQEKRGGHVVGTSVYKFDSVEIGQSHAEEYTEVFPLKAKGAEWMPRT